MGGLTGKTVMITGGAGGLGRAMAAKFLSEGSVVFLVDLKKEDLDEALKGLKDIGKNIKGYVCDVTKTGEVKKTIKDIKSNHKSVDILINNAGITRDMFFHKMEEKDWQKVLDVNLNGTYNCTRGVIADMRDNNFGRIINIASVVAQSGNVGQANYISSKAAIIGFTKALALENAPKGITVNAIAPGFTETDMISTIPEKVRKKLLSKIPLGRFGTPDDIANAAYFLASEDASYITGHTISINGGYYI